MSLQNAKINQLFATLRSQGFIARQNFLCCGNCASSAIADHLEVLYNKNLKKFNSLRGVVFFHRQDTASAINNNKLYLRYGHPLDGISNALDVERVVSVGEIICAELDKLGLKWSWNRSPFETIVVDLEW